MINKVVLVGRITKDVELTHTTNGVPKVQFVLAVNRTFTNQEGNREADFLLCVAWRKTAENMAKFLQKGSMIGVIGRLNTRHYEKDGTRVYATEVIAEEVQFLDKKSDQSQQGNTQTNQQSNDYNYNQYNQNQQSYQQQPQNNQQQGYQYQGQGNEHQPNFQEPYQEQQYAGSHVGGGNQYHQSGNSDFNFPNEDGFPF